MDWVGVAAVLWVCSSETRAWVALAGPWCWRQFRGGQKWH
jgi:hypothetical protein